MNSVNVDIPPQIEVLVSTMNQSDFSLIKKMNLNSDAIIANQGDVEAFGEQKISNGIVKMITTTGRGLGKNRNIGLRFASGDICLIADDDLMYEDDYVEKVVSGFHEIKDADIILFNVRSEDENEKHILITDIKKIGFMNFARWGSVRVAFKRNSIQQHDITFNSDFGSGSKYGSGEDSLFLRQALRNGLKIYTHPSNIAVLRKSESTWFTGYNDKYFFNAGAAYSVMFPLIKYFIIILMGLRFSVKLKLHLLRTLKQLFFGAKAQKTGVSYEDYFQKDG
jgi:glycosyltransferase involved in cell wall biosynthesis